MTLRPNDNEAAKFTDALAELDIGTAPGDISRERNRAFLASLFYNRGFTLVVFRVEQFVFDTLFVEVGCYQFVFGDLARADEHRTAGFVIFLDGLRDSFEFAFFSLVDEVLVVLAGNFFVWRHDDDIE